MKSLKSQKNGMVRAFITVAIVISFSSITIQNASAQCSINHIPKSICGFDDVIDSYTFNGVTANNLSCNGPNGYSNHGSINGFSAIPASTVNISATLGAGYNNQGLAIWIDFNNDQYYDTSEYVFSAGPDTSISGSIHIPGNVVATSIGMRVMSMAANVPLPSDACTHPSGYGETEDYLLNILPVHPNNAAVLSIDSPSTFCAGNKDIYVSIANLGTNRIDSLMINWEFNGVAQIPVKYSSLLDTLNGFNSNIAQVFLGNKSFPYGSADTIKIWTSMPNGLIDPFNFDDTISVVKKAALNGNITIDPSVARSSSNFNDFSSLAYELNNYGICGPVYVTISPGLYKDFFSLRKVFGSGPSNSITIDGVDSSTVTLSHDGTLSNATVSLFQTDHVIIKNITIEYLGTNSGSVVLLDEASHIVISNNELRMDSAAGSFDLENISIEGFPSSYNTISDNKIIGGEAGIQLNVVGNARNSMNIIARNDIQQIFNNGIFANNQDSIFISGNHIDVSIRGVIGSNGIRLENSFNSVVNANVVKSHSVGVYLDNYLNSSASNHRIMLTNNMIISDGTGLNISGIDSISIFHNSISANSSDPSISIVNWDTLPKVYDVRNNIFSSHSGLALYSNESMSIFTALDHNAYYSSAPNLVEINYTAYADLPAFHSAFPTYNNSSLQGDPQFVAANSDLHIIGNLVDDEGDNSVGINFDIDGDVRPMPSSIYVDIGADEFDPPSCPMPHSLFAVNPAIDSITLGWIGNGTSFYFQYVIVPAGNGIGSGNTVSVMDDTILVGGLSPSTSYDFFVREVCSRGDSSLWSGPYTFRTAEVLDYIEDFEAFETGELSHNWESISFSSNPSLEWTMDTLSQYGSVTHDHTFGTGGGFAYFKTNFGPGQAVLKSAPVFIGPNIGSFTLSFWYYMHGSDIGSLNVYLDTNLITSISGQQQANPTDPWLYFDTLITGYPTSQYLNLNFEANKGFGVLSEIAVDDVRLDSVLIVGLENKLRDEQAFGIYPNPSKGSFKLYVHAIEGEVELQISSMEGKLLLEKNYHSNGSLVEEVDMDDFIKGIYFVRLRMKDSIYVKKLVLVD